MVSKPLIYCCFPPAGIMIMTFLYGLASCLILFITGLLFVLSEKQSALLAHFFGVEDTTSFDCLLLLAESVIGFAYFYTCYLVYKRRYKPVMAVLNVLMLDILRDMYCLYTMCNAAYNRPPEEKRVSSLESLEAGGKQNDTMTEDDIKSAENMEAALSGMFALFLLVFCILPLINKVYVIIKIRAYARYIEYKKDEAKLSSTSVESLYCHPEIEKDY